MANSVKNGLGICAPALLYLILAALSLIGMGRC